MENNKAFIIRNKNVIGLSEKMGVTLSQEAYDALSDEKKNDGTIYFIPDGDGEIGIQDTIVSENSVWSSQKVSDEIAEVESKVGGLISDTTSSTTSTWSSQKTSGEIAEVETGLNANVTALSDRVKTVEDTYAKTTDIPTTLPANGGNADTVNNHTVKSDVPENAKFTDTIYDDTEVKAEIAKNGTPVGCIFPFAGINLPKGYLLCNGASYKVADYPDLYAVIGNTYGGDSTNFNVPDYRETVLVGVGENTTDTIADHDVYELGEFKDDQLQEHSHNYVQIYDSWSGTQGSSTRNLYTGVYGQTGTNSGRSGTTTHGKQKGVTYIIKAR